MVSILANNLSATHVHLQPVKKMPTNSPLIDKRYSDRFIPIRSPAKWQIDFDSVSESNPFKVAV